MCTVPERLAPRWPGVGILLAMGLCATSWIAAAPNSSPWVDTVATLTAALETLERDMPDADYANRFDVLAPIIRDTHDLDTMARLALGRTADDLTEPQRHDFDRLFVELTIASYATRFQDLGSGFEIRNDTPARGGRYSVEAELAPADRAPIRLDYLLHERDDRWLIINVLAEGVSDLALKRSQFAALFAERGFVGLRESLRAEIDTLRTD